MFTLHTNIFKATKVVSQRVHTTEVKTVMKRDTEYRRERFTAQKYT